MKFLLSAFLFLTLTVLTAFRQSPQNNCKAYANYHHISGKDTLNFLGENRFEIAVHSRGGSELLSGTCSVTDRLMELRFDVPEGAEIPAKTYYMYTKRGLRYVAEGSTGFYGYKRQLFKMVEEDLLNDRRSKRM